MSDDKPKHWRIRRGRLREVVRESHIREVPPEIIARIEALEAAVERLNNFAVNAAEVANRHSAHLVELKRELGAHTHTARVNELFEASVEIDGRTIPVKLTQKQRAA